MKKVLIFLLTLMLALGICAAAEQVAPEAGVETTLDLNGDGTEDVLCWDCVPLGEYDQELVVTVNGCEYPTEIGYLGNVVLDDIDGDGVPEIFVSGDVMSDDYVTYCLHYDGEKLLPVLFADGFRGDNTDGYYKMGYGYLTDITDGKVTLNGSQDILGTYFGSRVYELRDGLFEFCDDGLWRFDRDTSDADLWSYGALLPVQDIPAFFQSEDGSVTEGAVESGMPLVITATDKVQYAYFTTKDGRDGWFEVEPDYQQGWGVTIDGVSEGELFETVPYAD